jgi:hypothetical protein
MHANAKTHPAVLGQVGVVFPIFFLNFDRAADGLDRARELGKHAVAGLANSASTLSPALPNTRPSCRTISASMVSRNSFSVRSVASSSTSIRRLYPATSAARMAASRRFIEVSFNLENNDRGEKNQNCRKGARMSIHGYKRTWTAMLKRVRFSAHSGHLTVVRQQKPGRREKR